LEQALGALKTRVAQPEMEDLVWRLCQWQPCSTDELAHLLNRSRKYMLDRLVTPMLRAGRLAMTIPDQPNHPDQRYRAVVK
jgi:ATP-dependent DNA helicase RecG